MADPLISMRRTWNAEHARLRQWLEKRHDYGQALPLFLRHHAQIHTARLQSAAAGGWSFQDAALDGLTEAQLRQIPSGASHSAIWMLWHITRIEDAAVNVLLGDRTQVLHEGRWQQRLGVSTTSVGNEMNLSEVRALSAALPVRTLLAYRLAVGRRTAAVAQRLDPEQLWARPTAAQLQRLVDEGAAETRTQWLLQYWGGHNRANLLLMPASRHGLVHLNEITRLRTRLRRSLPGETL